MHVAGLARPELCPSASSPVQEKDFSLGQEPRVAPYAASWYALAVLLAASMSATCLKKLKTRKYIAILKHRSDDIWQLQVLCHNMPTTINANIMQHQERFAKSRVMAMCMIYCASKHIMCQTKCIAPCLPANNRHMFRLL